MMMTGSLKQAKHNALPRGLISCTNLPLIRLRPLSVFLFPSVYSFLPLSYDLRLFKSVFFVLDEIFYLFPLAMDGHLTGLSEPQAPSPTCLSSWEMDSHFSLLSVSALYMNTHMHSTCAHTLITSYFVTEIWPMDHFPYHIYSWHLFLVNSVRFV